MSRAVRDCIGIAIDSASVRAVELRRGRVRWAAEVARTEDEPLRATIAQLFAGLRRTRRGLANPRATIALGPDLVQAKMISGMPAVHDAALLSRMVAESSARFFLRNGVPLVTSAARLVDDGSIWAAAVEERTIADVLDACTQAGVVVRSVVPSVTVVGAGLEDGTLSWPAGNVTALLTLADGVPTTIRRAASTHGETEVQPASAGPDGRVTPPVPRAAMTPLGENAWRYADAFGAACAGRSAPLDLLPSHVDTRANVPRARMTIASLALVAALLAVFAAPGVRAMRDARSARAQLAAMGKERVAAEQVNRELGRMTAALGEVASFASTRRSYAALLSQLTGALPQQSAILSLRVDSTGGTLVALAPHAADVVRAVERVPEIVGPRIVGPVTREHDGDYDVERVTLAFTLSAPRGAR